MALIFVEIGVEGVTDLYIHVCCCVFDIQDYIACSISRKLWINCEMVCYDEHRLGNIMCALLYLIELCYCY